jgi:hypothetical protein
VLAKGRAGAALLNGMRPDLGSFRDIRFEKKQRRGLPVIIRLPETIVRRRCAALIPYARNPRTHSDQQVAQVAASIREFGFTNPVLIDQEDGIIAGHQHLQRQSHGRRLARQVAAAAGDKDNGDNSGLRDDCGGSFRDNFVV